MLVDVCATCWLGTLQVGCLLTPAFLVEFGAALKTLQLTARSVFNGYATPEGAPASLPTPDGMTAYANSRAHCLPVMSVDINWVTQNSCIQVCVFQTPNTYIHYTHMGMHHAREIGVR